MSTEETLEGARFWAKQEVAEGDPQFKIRIKSLTENSLCAIKGVEDDDGDKIQASRKLRFEMDDPDVVVEFQEGLPPAVVARYLRKILTMVEGPKGSEIVNLGSTKHGPDRAVRLSGGDVYVYRFSAEMDRLRAELAAAEASSADEAEECVPVTS